MLYIVMEYCPENLKGWHRQHLKEPNVLGLVREVLEALVYIHSSHLIHRDLKPANIFLKNGEVKVGDFGLAVGATERDAQHGSRSDRSSGVGTPLYRAPEIKTKRYDNKVDIFSLGVVILDLHHEFTTFHEKDSVLKAICEQHTLPPFLADRFSNSQLRHLVVRMLNPDPCRRPSAEELLGLIRGEHFVEILSCISSTDHYDYRALVKHLLSVRSTSRPVGTELALAKRMQPYLEAGGGLVSVSKLSLAFQFLERIWKAHCGVEFMLPEVVPEQQHRLFGDWAENKLPVSRDIKKLFLNGEGTVCEFARNSLQQWSSILGGYFQGENCQALLKGFCRLRVWEEQSFSYRSCMAFAYLEDGEYMFGSTDPEDLLDEVLDCVAGVER
jgi:hypothetical protein